MVAKAFCELFQEGAFATWKASMLRLIPSFHGAKIPNRVENLVGMWTDCRSPLGLSLNTQFFLPVCNRQWFDASFTKLSRSGVVS